MKKTTNMTFEMKSGRTLVASDGIILRENLNEYENSLDRFDFMERASFWTPEHGHIGGAVAKAGDTKTIDSIYPDYDGITKIRALLSDLTTEEKIEICDYYIGKFQQAKRLLKTAGDNE